MADKRRGHGEDSIYFDHRVGTECRDARLHKRCAGRWRGVVSLGPGGDGRRMRRKVSGQTKADVRDKLQALHDELREGVRTSATYTVRHAVDEWLAHGLTGVSAKTLSTNREVTAPLLSLIGAAKLRDLSASDVRKALGRLAESRSTRAVAMHTFESVMSEQGVPVEEIARLVGHSVTTTETVYRRELRPVISTGAEVMDTIFKVR